MPRKKKQFNKKNALHFQLVHRSQSDPLWHEDSGSQYVLLPVNRRAKDDSAAMFDMEDLAPAVEPSSKTGAGPEARAGAGAGAGAAAGAGAGAGAAAGGTDFEGMTKLRSKFDEVDEFNFPLDGYNYQQHLRPMGGGGVFISATGQRVSSDAVKPKAKPVAIPKEALPSEEVSDRMLDSIVVNPQRLPGDMRAALEGDIEEFEELTDDFVLLAGGDDDDGGGGGEEFAGAGFDIDAHFAKLMEQAKREDAAAAAARGGTRRHDDDDDDTNLWSGHAEAKRDSGGDDEDDDDDELDDEALAAAHAEQAADRPRRFLDDHLDVILAQYSDEQIGELEPDDPTVVGNGRQERMLEAAMQQFLQENKSTPMVTYPHAREGYKEPEDEPGRVVPFGWGEDDIPDAGTDLPMPLPPQRAEFDCETIVSTYTTTENHPTYLDDEPLRPIKLSAKTGMPVLREGRSEDGDDGDYDDDDGDSDGIAAASAAVATVRPKGETKEDRRARKQAVKELRRLKREQKKATKDAFREEEKRQLRTRKLGTKQSVFKM